MKNKNIILAVGLAGLAVFLYMKNKKSSTVSVPTGKSSANGGEFWGNSEGWSPACGACN